MPKYLLTDEKFDIDLCYMKETNPSPSTNELTYVSVSRYPACTYARFEPLTSYSPPDDFLNILESKTGWRTETPLNGTLQAGNWTIKVVVKSNFSGGGTSPLYIRMGVRLTKSPCEAGGNIFGSCPVTLLALSDSPNVLTIPNDGVSRVNDSWNIPLDAVTFNNEYLFVEFRYHVEQNASRNASVKFICDEDPAVAEESVTTPAFIPAMPEIEVSAQTSADADTQVSTIAETEISTPISADADTLVETQISAQASIDVDTLVETEISTPISVDADTLAEIEISAQVSIDVDTLVETEISTPISVDADTLAEIEVSTQIYKGQINIEMLVKKMSTPPSLSDILTQVLNALQTIMYEIASAIAENASVIATAVVLGGIAFLVMNYGARIFRGVTSWVRGLF